jgi:ethanolamine utilization protein EutA
MADSREIISVGIDIGTTTTQVVFSQLSLNQITRPGQIPRVDISDRKILHESAIVFTPLQDSDTIDAEKLAGIISHEYQIAGLLPENVETGAVIITGETAKKNNADQILTAIAGLAGDFVVTVAGPNLEGVIAGKGSGAANYSRQHFTTVTNIDIGGGSANSAVFRQGNTIATAAMNYGGRIIELDPQTGIITGITRSGAAIMESAGINLDVGMTASLPDLVRVADEAAAVTVNLIEGTRSPLADKLYQTAPSPISGVGKPVMFSGGIGHYYYFPADCSNIASIARHGDIGPLVSQSLKQNSIISSYTILQPAETQRATVLGASSQTLTLSGSTIWAESAILPLKNVPVIRSEWTDQNVVPSEIAGAIEAALQRWDVKSAADHFAISIELDFSLDYQQLTRVAEGLAQFSKQIPGNKPVIIILKRDYAQAVGQTLKGLIGKRPLLVIDQVGLEEGDYIDIGSPLMDGRVVPLVVKTLVFTT